MSEILEITGLDGGYGRLQVLREIAMTMREGQSVALLGANGAGKTTLLKTLMGLLPAWRGSIRFLGEDITGLPTYQRVRRGLSYMSELGVFPSLSVMENLRIGAYLRRGGGWRSGLDAVWELFPDLAGRPRALAANLSGGQRKMLGIARALMGRPKLVVMDEPSAGLSPLFVKQVLEAVGKTREEGYTFLIAEQNVQLLGELEYGYVLDAGRIAAHGAVAELQRNDVIRRAYFGLLDKESGSRSGERPRNA